MRFIVITHTIHKIKGNQVFAYAPYVREMNLWIKGVDRVIVVAPVSDAAPDAIEMAYHHSSLEVWPVPALHFGALKRILPSLWALPRLILLLFKAMRNADHVQLRCPGNMGLLGCFVQLFFPFLPKSAKYAGNWDWNSVQPWSYRLQQLLLRNPYLTRNMTALVYGNWPDRTRNILPAFTASYHREEAIPTEVRPLDHKEPIRLLFVGTLSENKRPFLAVETAILLKSKGFDVRLDLFGDGPQKASLSQKIAAAGMEACITLHGNTDAEALKMAYQSAHFLLFASRSEGWPKAVAEAMFWGCFPVTTAVSCIPQMLGEGRRGYLLAAPLAENLVEAVERYLAAPEEYQQQCTEAMEWSRQYTLEAFETQISGILTNGARTASH